MKNIIIKVFANFWRILKDCDQKVRYDSYRKKYKIAKSFKFNGDRITLGGEGEIILGAGSYIGNYSSIQAGKNVKVVIGDNTSISHNVRIYSTSRYADQDFSNTKLIYSKDVIIGSNVWIGANVFINPGVIISDGVVVGANSVVTKHLKTNCIYAGAPAKLIRVKTNC